MKFNKWTLGLAAVGVVSLTSAVQADETKMNAVQTALSTTTLSGYVDASIQYNPTGGGSTAQTGFNGGKSNGFNLNVVDLALDKPEDESPWAAGYHVELWVGPDASTLATSPLNSYSTALQNYEEEEVYRSGIGSDFAIRQAYITLRTPIGNGIDWKLGVFDTIIGYESNSSGLNPNYTHSYGYYSEPTTHTGLLATYAFTSALSVTAGIADSKGPLVNDRTPQYTGHADSFKTYMASITYTAPQSWGWAAGSTLSAGVINGTFTSIYYFSGPYGYQDASTSYYAGLSMSTPWAALKVGASFDDLTTYDGSSNPWATAIYATYQATPKLSFNSRGELAKPSGGSTGTVFAFTETVEYDMWANVMTRLELRWDSTAHGDFGGSTYNPDNGQRNAVMIALQAIYKF
jgi:hypothetical protein